MVFNFIIAGCKLFVATVVTRSASLFAEGLHSAADGCNSLSLLFGIIQGKRSPDRTHPFGYGLETNFWALLASIVLFGSAIAAILMGYERLRQPESLSDLTWAIVILILSVVLEVFAVYTAARAVLEEVNLKTNVWRTIPLAFANIRNVVGPTTRFVFYEDSLALLGALIALVALVGSQIAVSLNILSPAMAHYPDAIASILIGLLLFALAINLFSYNRSFLTGSAAPPTVERRIHDLVLATHGVSEIHDLKTINQGMSGLFIHMKVKVDPETLVKDVDDLTDRIRDRIQDHISNARQVFIEVLADDSEQEWGEKFTQLIEEGQSQGVLKPREVTILRNVYDFTESVVRDIMVPRTDAVLVDVDTPLSEVASLMIERRHSRLPVFEETIDDIIGIVHAQDVFDRIRKHEMDVPLRDVLREVDIYPENKPVSDLLEDFKRNKIQMAVVADEHGGFSGLVTIEDLLEEIVGELWDEHDVQEELISLVDPNRLVISGKYEIWELNERYGLSIPDDEFKTIGGFVFGQLGREPENGDTVQFEDLTITVDECDGPRIKLVTIASPMAFELAIHTPMQEGKTATTGSNGHSKPASQDSSQTLDLPTRSAAASRPQPSSDVSE